ncbi:MAG: alpha/beta hydrolase [Synergistaceae bacterium]|nr:alpha/beta hydrolase [Synergistaceae bacterium]MBQ3449487.1 alpha/beta hydrolase [Synergistaceae bacterium]
MFRALTFSVLAVMLTAGMSFAVETDTRVFKIDPEIKCEKVQFHNRFGIELTGDIYLPKDFDISKKYAGIAVAGPFGAVKEQVSGLYAQEMAKNGFVAIAFDPSFTGESGGTVRDISDPSVNTEDYSAAVDFLSTQSFIDPERIGIIGVCGWGGIALNAAAIDTRIKATVSSTMYNMSRIAANGYFDNDNSEEKRYNMKKALNEQRTKDYANGSYAFAGGVIDPLPEDAPQFVKDYYAYYKTPRGYHARSVNSNKGWTVTSSLALMNMPMLAFVSEIRTPVLLVHGEKAHSRYMSEDTFKLMKGDNKELVIIPDATHTDLYDNMEKIPFVKIVEFMNANLK